MRMHALFPLRLVLERVRSTTWANECSRNSFVQFSGLWSPIRRHEGDDNHDGTRDGDGQWLTATDGDDTAISAKIERRAGMAAWAIQADCVQT